MTRLRDLSRFAWLLRTYLAPYWAAVLLLVATSYLATALAALFPVLMAPILDLALGSPAAGASGATGGLSLSTLGARVLEWLGVSASDDRFRAILWLCVAYVAVGFAKGWLDFGNFILALLIRVRAGAAMQMDLFRPVHGAITMDGRDLRTLRQDSSRKLFGVVAQEALLFNATIRENITYGREGIAEAEVVRAARVANAHDFIQEFPDGYETVVGDRGIRLSGGQRQRVAIARAVVGRPPILILDEATSSLDSESERVVQQAIDRAVQGATSVVIAHRLSTVLHADKIVVLGRGGVEAVGRHADLLAGNETYGRLYRLQFAEAGTLGDL